MACRRSRRCLDRIAAATVLVAVWCPIVLLGSPATAQATTARAATATSYQRPVEGDVRTRFDGPEHPWEAGHRGVDLEAEPGATVRAGGPGRVSFAGTVAGTRWVTLAHPDGVRTTYGPLDEVHVELDGEVEVGTPLGTVASGHGGSLHWSARDVGGSYFDPMLLLRPRLVPTLVGRTSVEVTDLPEYHRYREWRGRAPGLRGALGMVEGSRVADQPGWQLAPNPNHVIGVAGLNSDSSLMPMDLTFLGYHTGDITYLSYAGRDGALGGTGPRRDQLPYTREDTWRGVHEAAVRLRDQLRAQWGRSPGQAVDLVGHSMGGLTVAYYLMLLHDPADPTLPPVGNVVTLASPLHGSDLATGLRYAARAPGVPELVRGAGALLGDPQPGPDDQATLDLVLDSAVSDAIVDAWLGAVQHPYAGPLATGTRMLTLGGSRDLIVPERRTSLPGGEHVVVPGGHDRMRRTEAGYSVVRDFLAGEPYAGGPGGLGHLASYPLGWAYRAAGLAIGLPYSATLATPPGGG